MLIYLLQRVWFNGGFKGEYCSVKISEYCIWIFKVAVKVFGGRFCSWSRESRWALAARCHLHWGHLAHTWAQGIPLQPRNVAWSIRSSCKHLKVGATPLKSFAAAEFGRTRCEPEQWGSSRTRAGRAGNSVTVTKEGGHLLIYLLCFYYVMLATFLRQYFFWWETIAKAQIELFVQ